MRRWNPSDSIAEEVTLMVADSGELGRHAVAVPAKGRPVWSVVYVDGFLRTMCGE